MRRGGWIIGSDECGTGCIAGGFVVCAAALTKQTVLPPRVMDSKDLEEAEREAVAKALCRTQRFVFRVVYMPTWRIDSEGHAACLTLAFQTAIQQIREEVGPVAAYLDGDKYHDVPMSHTIIRGDGSVPVISAASIIGKAYRDGIMRALHLMHPCYGLDKHKGYPTKEHKLALQVHGPCEFHRKSTTAVQKVLR